MHTSRKMISYLTLARDDTSHIFHHADDEGSLTQSALDDDDDDDDDGGSHHIIRVGHEGCPHERATSKA